MKKPLLKKINGMKRCPDCKGHRTCATCDGHGQVRIVQGRKKGSKFERDIAAEVTEWTGMEFKRTPMSGGWAKTGDITPKNPKHMVDFPFSMELKNQQVFNIAHFARTAHTKRFPAYMTKWWAQCTDDAKKAKKIPLLVMTRANDPVLIMMRTRHFKEMRFKNLTVLFRLGKLRLMLWKEFIEMEYDAMFSNRGRGQ